MVNLINRNLSVICQVSHEVHNANILLCKQDSCLFCLFKYYGHWLESTISKKKYDLTNTKKLLWKNKI